MKKGLFIAIISAVLVCAFALPSLFAEDAPADGLTMDHWKSEKNNKVATFNHSTHKAIDCKECHHTGDYKSCVTAGCHDVFDNKDKTEKSYYKVLHANKAKMSTCISCHKKEAGSDKDKKKKLTSCKGACHD